MSANLSFLFENSTHDEIIKCLDILGIKIWNMQLDINTLDRYSDDTIMMYLDWTIKYPTLLFGGYFSQCVRKKITDIVTRLHEHFEHLDFYVKATENYDNDSYIQKLFDDYTDAPVKINNTAYANFVSLREDVRLNDLGGSEKIAYYLNSCNKCLHFDTFARWNVSKNRARNVYKILTKSNNCSGLLEFMIVNFEHFTKQEFAKIMNDPIGVSLNAHKAYVVCPEIWDTDKFKSARSIKFGTHISKVEEFTLDALVNYIELFPKKKAELYLYAGRYLRWYPKKQIRLSLHKINKNDLDLVRWSNYKRTKSILVLNNFGLILGAKKLYVDDMSYADANELYAEYIMHKPTVSHTFTKVYSNFSELHKLDLTISHDIYMPFTSNRYAYVNLNILNCNTDRKRVQAYNMTGDISYINLINMVYYREEDLDAVGIKKVNAIYIFRIKCYDYTGRFSGLSGDNHVFWPNTECVLFNYKWCPAAFRVNDDYRQVDDIEIISRAKIHDQFTSVLRANAGYHDLVIIAGSLTESLTE